MADFSDIILVTDLDDTLLTKDKRISDEDYKALCYFVENGGSFTIATGRVYISAKPFADALPINLPLVLYNGAVIYDDKAKKTVWKQLMPPTAIGYMNDLLKRFDTLGSEIVCEKKVYIYKPSSSLDDKLALEQIPFEYCDENNIPDEIVKLLLVGETDEIEVAAAEIKKTEYPDVDFMLSSKCYCEMLPKGASKAVGINKMTEILGIKGKKIVAAGDYDNDIAMIEAADLGATVSNAPQRIKDRSDLVLTKTSDEGAIAELISYIEHNF